MLYVIVVASMVVVSSFFFFQAEDGIRDLVRSRGLGDVYKRQHRQGEQVAQGDDRALLTGVVDELRQRQGERLGRLVGRGDVVLDLAGACLLYTSPSPRDRTRSRMPSSA